MKHWLTLLLIICLMIPAYSAGDAASSKNGKDLLNRGNGELKKIERAVRNNQFISKYDFDQDKELTYKDVSYFKKFILNKEDEFYLNLDHLNWLNEKETVQGADMMITRLYAEPNNPDDISQGYHYVGDPQEGIAALDDVSRAVTAYVEHYKLYKDNHSLSKIKEGLEFVMWMQEEDGDFRNFVALNDKGEIYKRDSHSSSKTFSYWAVRAYTSLSYSYEILAEKDPEFAQRVKEHMDRSSHRINERVKPNYGTFITKGGKDYPAWDLYDNWVSTIALDALTKHYEISPDATVKENIQMLGESLYASQFGDFIEFPFGGFMSTYSDRTDIWNEWGSQQAASMALAGEAIGNKNWIAAAELAADSFLSDLLISGRAFSKQPNAIVYPQINYGTASYVDNFIKLFEVTGKEKYAFMAGVAGQWWLGNNDKDVPMFNQEYGIAFDAIDEDKVNRNSGAESNVEAIRALARILQNDISKTALFSTEKEKNKAVKLEVEDQYIEKPDDPLTVSNASLSNPDTAIVSKPFDDPGLDETNEKIVKNDVIPEESRDRETEIVEDWQGQNALFVKGSGYNNTRLYDDAYLYQDIPIKDKDSKLQAGDSVNLEFATRLEFDTQLNAEVIALNGKGEGRVISEVQGVNYHYRHWYSGESAIKTVPVSAIPEDTMKLRIKFSVASDNEWFNKGYVSLADVQLFKANTPELRAGGTDFSKGLYIEMPSGQEKEIVFPEKIQAGEYRVYASARTNQEPSEISMKFPNEQTLSLNLTDKKEYVKIFHAGDVKIAEGQEGFKLINNGEASADIDQITLYPVQSSAVYETQKGKHMKVVRDSIANTLVVDEEKKFNKRDTIYSAYKVVGKHVRVTGSINDSKGRPAKNKHLTITAGSKKYSVKSNSKGEFTKVIPYDDELKRIEIKTGKNISYLYF